MNTKSLLQTLVEAESPSHDKAAVDRVGAIVAEEARKLGAHVEIISNTETGDHVLSKWGSGANGILFLGHMDTVYSLGTLQRTPFREDSDKILGPGTMDMKAGIVISLAAIEAVQTQGLLHRPITLLCTSDEEIGSHTSRAHIERLAKESVLVLVMEPAMPDGSVKTWRKGVGEFRVKAKGRAAHAGGDHEKGRNAIEELAHQIITIQKLTDYSRQTTLNVGVINGGSASNVVPEEARIQGDVRVMQPGEWERIEAEVKNLKPVLDGTSLEVAGDEKAKTIAARIGMNITAGGTGGASDGNFVASLGIPLLDGMGAVGDGAHSEREYIFTASIEQKAKLIASLIHDW